MRNIEPLILSTEDNKFNPFSEKERDDWDSFDREHHYYSPEQQGRIASDIDDDLSDEDYIYYVNDALISFVTNPAIKLLMDANVIPKWRLVAPSSFS